MQMPSLKNLVLRSTIFTNRTPFSVTSPVPHSVEWNSPFLTDTVVRRANEALNGKKDSTTEAKTEKRSYNIEIPGVTVMRTKFGEEFFYAPCIEASKLRGMLRSEAAKIAVKGQTDILTQSYNLLAKGGKKNSKSAKAVAEKTKSKDPISDLLAQRLAEPVIGLFGAFSDDLTLAGSLRVGHAMFDENTPAEDRRCIELDGSGARGEVTDQPENLLFLDGSDYEPKKDGEQAQRQIVYRCRVALGVNFTHEMRLSRVTDLEIGLFFLALQRMHQRGIMGGRASQGNGGTLDFDYDLYMVDEETLEETHLGQWSALLADDESVVNDWMSQYEHFRDSEGIQYGRSTSDPQSLKLVEAKPKKANSARA